MAEQDDEPKRPMASRLVGMAPPGAKVRQPPPEPAALPEGRDAGEVEQAAKAPGWAEVLGGGIGGFATLTGMAASAPVPPISVVVAPRTDEPGKTATSLTELARASLARDAEQAAEALGFAPDGITLAGAGTVRLEITVEIGGVTAGQAAEAVDAIRAAAVGAAERTTGGTAPDGFQLPVEATAGETPTIRSFLLGSVGPTADMVRLAGEVVGDFAKAGLGVLAGVEVIRGLRKTRLRKATEAERPSPADGVMTVTVEFRAAARKPEAPSAEAELKRLKDFSDGAASLAKLLDRLKP